MVANSTLFETLRFGSSIPGGYWGCCAGDIMQCFKSDPDAPASCQSVHGDSGMPTPTAENGESLFFGPTNKDIFLQRLRVGTFGRGDMPNHFFLCVLTDGQLRGEFGRKWLAILKEAGFEFIRSVSNSVYSDKTAGKPTGTGHSLNYVFGLFRNIGDSAPVNPFTPPVQWTELPSVKPEAYELIADTAELAVKQYEADLKVWNDIGPAKLLTEAEIVAAGAPVILAGQRSEYPQEKKEVREERDTAKGKKKEENIWAAPIASLPPAAPA